MALYSFDFLSTGCKAIDTMLNGGIRRGEVTLVYGKPDTGKTSLAIQCTFLCAQKGLKTIYVDSDNTFSLNRLAQIAGSELDTFAPLIFIFKPRSFDEQSQLITNLESYNLESIALIIVDAVTTLYRLQFTPEEIFTLNMGLNWQLAHLNELALSHQTPILLTSQVHTMVRNNQREKTEPIANRVLKFWAQKIINLESTSDPTVKKAILVKSPQARNKMASCFYKLAENGLRSIKY